MSLIDPLFINLLKRFSPDDIAEFLRQFSEHGKTGSLFCTFWTGTEIVDNQLRFVDLPSLVFGRDIFGRKSLCYRIRGSTVECKRIPGERLSDWRDVPQGTVVIIRSLEMTRNGVILVQPDAALHFQFCFKDLWQSQAYVFAFIRNDPVNMFIERLKTSVKDVTFYPIPGGESLLELNTELYPQEDIEEMKKNSVNEFIKLFETILPLRYLPPKPETLLFLFSGGVDSLFVTLIAAMVANEEFEFVLVNVSFSENGEDFEMAPDRKRGLESLEFLKQKFPQRTFHFLRVNVTKDELQKKRSSIIASVVAPGSTVLDDSIGCVVWFASRAKGIQDGIETRYDYVERVFVGSGSDEILGGYSRHRGIFDREGYGELFNELRSEIQNIGNRNLGRDDRIMLSNGRMMLAPFIDEDIIRFVNLLPIQLKVDFSLPRGIGEKIILREALKELGTPETLYTAPKKAMQFGTRIAKLENRSEKGSDQCLRLLA
uniref:Asparagine synthetase domain-containing protein n=1 Tax=Panagrolaimus sp. PS1159 TaxID=55785 RepID=A0AC35GII6_9BILA